MVLIHLGRLSNNAILHNTIEQDIAALERELETTTTLDIYFDDYEPTHQNNRHIVEPVCRCLSNRRALPCLTFHATDHPVHGIFDVLQQFLIAAKQCGVRHLQLIYVSYFPMELFVDFCHDNTELKFVDMRGVTFSDGGCAAMSRPPQHSSVSRLALDELRLDGVRLENSTAATTFANFIARVTVQSLKVGRVSSRYDNEDKESTERTLSKIKMPSVQHLTLLEKCHITHFRAALKAGTTSVTELNVSVADSSRSSRLELMAVFIRRAVQLNILWISRRLTPPPRRLFRAIQKCATVTRIRMKFEEILPDITTRNQELARFVSNPSIYPTDHLPDLMRQFDKCPTGRYMLARCLPEILAFDQIKSTDSSAEPKDKKRKHASWAQIKDM